MIGLPLSSATLYQPFKDFNQKEVWPQLYIQMADLDDFQQSVLDAHNKLRMERGVPTLKWAEDIATTADNWAQNIAEKGYLQNSDNQVLGENIMLTTDDISGDQVVLKWLEQEDIYDYERQRWQRGTSQFTQMLWRASTEFAVAKAPLKNKDGFVIVANYRPRGNGNRPGEYEKNVPSRSEDTV